MDLQLQQIVLNEARSFGATVSEDFYAKLDAYVEQHFRYATSQDKKIIQTYLARAGVQIAKTEGKRLVEADDAKAAIWLFHLPTQPDDPCKAAGDQALAEERRRTRYTRGLLTENFGRYLD